MMLGMVETGMAETAMVGPGKGRGVRSDQRSQLTCDTSSRGTGLISAAYSSD